MKRARSMIYMLFCILFGLSACTRNPVSKDITLDTLAPESEMTITSSKSRVSDFVAKNADFTSPYNSDECYNITPAFVAEKCDYMIFKYSESAESFITYDGEAYSIGTCFGGFGLTSTALADLDEDGRYELYYTFSWGSGLHRSQIGYFDPVRKEITVFDYSLMDSDMILTVNESGDLCVNSATLDMGSFVDFSIEAQDIIGSVDFEGDSITLNITQPA